MPTFPRPHDESLLTSSSVVPIVRIVGYPQQNVVNVFRMKLVVSSGLYSSGGVPKTKAEKIFKALLNGITSTVAKGDKVTFFGFGSFERVERAARAGRNIQTGEVMQYLATMASKFKAGAAFKNTVKGA